MVPGSDGCSGSPRRRSSGHPLAVGAGALAVVLAASSCGVLIGIEPLDGGPCYTGPAGTEGVGLCVAGVGTSATDPECAGQITPRLEDCGSADDESCDGEPGCTGHELWNVAGNGAGELVDAKVAASAGGAVYLAGTFQGSLALRQPDGKVGVALDAAGGTDIFVAKLDAAGRVAWSRRFGDADPQQIRGIAADERGVVIAGAFRGVLDLGGAALHGALEEDDGFVARLGPDGAPVFATHLRSPADSGTIEWAEAVALDPGGDVFVFADHNGELDLGDALPALPATGRSAGALVRLDERGAVRWAVPFGGPDGDVWPTAVARVAGSSRLAVAGAFTGQLPLGPGLVSAGGEDVFVAIFDGAEPSGASFAAALGGELDDVPRGVAADATGNVVVALEHSASVSFGGSAIAEMPAGELDPDALVVGLSTIAPGSARFVWRLSGSGAQHLGGIAGDSAGGLAVVGSYTGSPPEGGAGFEVPRGADSFVVRLDASGAEIWAADVGGAGDEAGLAVVVDATGAVYAAGRYTGSLDELAQPIPAGDDAFDLFLMKRAP